MDNSIAENFELLFCKDSNIAYKAMLDLQEESEKTKAVYSYMDSFDSMLDSANAYARIRGLVLIAHNARWDEDNKIDEIIDRYLLHIMDVKPIVARKCISLLPLIAENKPELSEDIVRALQKANTLIYAESMQPLVHKDIQNSLTKILKM